MPSWRRRACQNDPSHVVAGRGECFGNGACTDEGECACNHDFAGRFCNHRATARWVSATCSRALGTSNTTCDGVYWGAEVVRGKGDSHFSCGSKCRLMDQWGVGSNSAPAFSDISGDGLDDAVVGRSDGTLMYFRQNPGGYSSFSRGSGRVGTAMRLTLVSGKAWVAPGLSRLPPAQLEATLVWRGSSYCRPVHPRPARRLCNTGIPLRSHSTGQPVQFDQGGRRQHARVLRHRRRWPGRSGRRQPVWYFDTFPPQRKGSCRKLCAGQRGG